ncbi:MAG TPA: hypothetical protein VIU15_03790 [Streptomyces sp.]
MTSTTDTTEHPDVTEISDLTEGLLTPSRSAELHRHLDDCDLCADTYASLEEIRGLLDTFAEPVTMPDDVAQRIDATLATEAMLAAAAAPMTEAAAPLAAVEAAVPDSTQLDVPRETTAHDVSRETPPRDVSRETSPADRPSGRPRATTGPGRKDKSAGKDRPRSRRRTVTVLGVFTAAALGLGSVLLSSLMNDGDNGTTAADTFSTGSLPQDVVKLLPGKHRTATPKGEVGIQGNSEGPQVLQAANVPTCVQQGTARTDTALATKSGVYKGKDVLLVVFTNTKDAQRVDAYLVDTACVKDPATQADVLFKATYARP